MKLKIKNEELQELNNITNINFPKYTSQLINWANCRFVKHMSHFIDKYSV